jgi:hypothetical protein
VKKRSGGVNADGTEVIHESDNDQLGKFCPRVFGVFLNGWRLAEPVSNRPYYPLGDSALVIQTGLLAGNP